MKLEDFTREELVYLKLWSEWIDEMEEMARRGCVVSDREDDLLIAYFENIGERPPVKGSPICFMFRAFIAGVDKGIDIMMDLEPGETREEV